LKSGLVINLAQNLSYKFFWGSLDFDQLLELILFFL
jgi:hypothetical protein